MKAAVRPSGTGMARVEARLKELERIAASGDVGGLARLVEDRHPSDIADLLASINTWERRRAFLNALPLDVASDALVEMEEDERRAELLCDLDVDRGARLVSKLADDDAADLMGEVEPRARARILSALPSRDAGEIRNLLRYDPDTAGGLMTTQLLRVLDHEDVSGAIDAIRAQEESVEDQYAAYVTDRRGVLAGTVPLDDLLVADPSTKVAQLVQSTVARVTTDVDQEEVGRIMARYHLVSIPVVDAEGALRGQITIDDVINVIEEESTEDILRLAGVSETEELRASWTKSVRSRLPWLSLNLVTASLAASVILRFQGEIRDMAFLAFLMPVIAALGGNTGTQSLAVTIRRIAVGDDFPSGRFAAVGKEALVGALNGLVLGALFGAFAYLYYDGDPRMGLIVLLAMWVNVIVAGFAGAVVPTMLHRLGVDPAIASSVFVQTLTDLVGFVMVLGLAAALYL